MKVKRKIQFICLIIVSLLLTQTNLVRGTKIQGSANLKENYFENSNYNSEATQNLKNVAHCEFFRF